MENDLLASELLLLCFVEQQLRFLLVITNRKAGTAFTPLHKTVSTTGLTRPFCSDITLICCFADAIVSLSLCLFV